MPIGTAIAIGSAIYGGGKALGLWGKPPEKKYKQSAEEKAYFAELERRSREGIGAGSRFRAQNVMTSRLANVEQSQRLAQKGQSLFAGTRGVASREQGKVGTESMYRALVEGSLEISERDELSKIKAQDKLGQLGLEKSARESEMAYSNAMAQYSSKQAGMSTMFAGLQASAPGLDKLFGFATDPVSKSLLGKAIETVSSGGTLNFDDEAGLFKMFIGMTEEKQEEFEAYLSKAEMYVTGINK